MTNTASDAAMPPKVRAAFEAMPAGLRACFQALRQQALLVASQDGRIGPLDESLKWGEPAYRPRNGAGSTVRLAVAKGHDDRCGVFFICNTGLVDGFRAEFPELDCVGNRAILVDPTTKLPNALHICLHRAFSYHLRTS